MLLSDVPDSTIGHVMGDIGFVGHQRKQYTEKTELHQMPILPLHVLNSTE